MYVCTHTVLQFDDYVLRIHINIYTHICITYVYVYTHTVLQKKTLKMLTRSLRSKRSKVAVYRLRKKAERVNTTKI